LAHPSKVPNVVELKQTSVVRPLLGEQMQDAIENFRDYYADKFAGGMPNFLGSFGQSIIGQLQDAIQRPRSTIYLFGNGGSHAICKCLEYALQAYATSRDLPLRVQTGIDIHKATWLKTEGSPGMSFIRVLEAEGADSRDTVVLISGSGDSDNLCEVVRYAEDRSIPTLAIIGSSRGKLRDLMDPSRCFCVTVEDQQISEDIIQSVTYFINQPITSIEQTQWSEFVCSQAEKLRCVIQQIPASFIAGMAQAVVDAFCCDKFVWVLGFDHPSLSVCAEHTAHNFNWDAVYLVDDPPKRLISSSPTACNFSGISNDRRREVISNLAGVSKAEQRGVALLYSLNLGNHTLDGLLTKLVDSDVPVFLLSAEGQLAQSHRGVAVHNTALQEPQIQAGISQIVGHMLGRVIRMKLMERQKSGNGISDQSRFLIDFDMAQRRLLDGN
jgi:D-sedoheptulose 7-phosphate isomerase